MTVSVNTTLSLTLVLSDDSSPEPSGIPSHVTSRRWADVASDMSYHSRTSQVKDIHSETFPNASDLISALSSSRAEVDLLKEQVAELRAERETTATTIAEAVKQQVAQVLAAQLKPILEDHITGQQFHIYIQTQDRKFEALTAMFTQMMATQMPQNAFNQTHVENPQGLPNLAAIQGLALGKRNAVQDLEEVLELNQASDIEPRQLMETSSPCQVPVPDSPTMVNLPSIANLSATQAKSTTEVLTRTGQATTYHQQSMAKYLSGTTGTSILHPPNVVRVNSGQSPDNNIVTLSDAEDASQLQSSSIECETPTTPTSTKRRRGLYPGV